MAGISIFIKSNLNDKIKTIHIQNPGVSIKHFDLLIIPEHDQVTGSNIIQTKGALNFFDYSELENKYEYLRQNNEKTILLMVGGKNKRYTPQSIDYLDLSMKVISTIKNTNGKLLLSVSRRTPQKAIRILDKLFSKSLNNYEILYTSKNNPYPDILKSIDYGIVTSDSVNMISEIATTPIPVFIYKFPKESGKILDFLDDLESLGIIKILHNKLFTYKKTKLNTNKDTALKVNKFLGI
jgi:mitochondrial fission protein ELM1